VKRRGNGGAGEEDGSDLYRLRRYVDVIVWGTTDSREIKWRKGMTVEYGVWCLHCQGEEDSTECGQRRGSDSSGAFFAMNLLHKP
jgi:hypothetical protein